MGSRSRDVRHLLLSHIHLDHAGAAGALVREHPALTVWVSAVGAPHLVDPSRLERSARRLYGDAFDTLWGELAPVPEANVRIADGDVLGLETFPTPGHASHHVCYLDGDGTLYAGDAAGVRIQPARYIVPRLAAARHRRRGLARDDRRDRQPSARAARADPLRRRDATSPTTSSGSEPSSTGGRRACATASTPTSSSAAARADAGADADLYDRVAPFWQSWHGLRRYWDKRAAADAA